MKFLSYFNTIFLMFFLIFHIEKYIHLLFLIYTMLKIEAFLTLNNNKKNLFFVGVLKYVYSLY